MLCNIGFFAKNQTDYYLLKRIEHDRPNHLLTRPKITINIKTTLIGDIPMSRSDDVRVFSFHEIKLEAASSKGKPYPPYGFDIYKNGLIGAYNKKISIEANSKKSTYKIQDIKETQDRISILLKHTDKKRRDQTLENNKKDLKRNIIKEEGEGFSFTSHIVIYKECLSTIIEESSGFTISRIEIILNRLLRNYYKTHEKLTTKIDDPTIKTKTGKSTVQAFPKISLRGVASQEFIENLRTSKISEIQLITKHIQEGFIEIPDGVHEKSATAILSLDKVLREGDSAWEKIKQICRLNKDNYEAVLIKYQPENENLLSARCSTDTFQLLNEDKLVKKISTQWVRVRDSYDEIQNDVINRIHELRNETS